MEVRYRGNNLNHAIKMDFWQKTAGKYKVGTIQNKKREK